MTDAIIRELDPEPTVDDRVDYNIITKNDDGLEHVAAHRVASVRVGIEWAAKQVENYKGPGGLSAKNKLECLLAYHDARVAAQKECPACDRGANSTLICDACVQKEKCNG
jgi:hypothetical protein